MSLNWHSEWWIASPLFLQHPQTCWHHYPPVPTCFQCLSLVYAEISCPYTTYHMWGSKEANCIPDLKVAMSLVNFLLCRSRLLSHFLYKYQKMKANISEPFLKESRKAATRLLGRAHLTISDSVEDARLVACPFHTDNAFCSVFR